MAARSDTGGPIFHALLESDFECVDTLTLPSWPQLDERLTIWKRRGGGGGDDCRVGGSAAAAPPDVTFSAYTADAEAEIDEVTREATLAMLRSSFDREWMTALFVRAARARLLPGGASSRGAAGAAAKGGVSDAERRMLERCLGRMSRMSPAWLERMAGRLAQRWLV